MNRIYSGTVYGIEGIVIEVETDISFGLISFNIVGLPDNAIKEAKVRVMSAIKNSNITIPQKRITVNLAPADIKKDGSAFDLPIAIGVLSGFGYIDYLSIQNYLIVGELSLFGDIRSIHGVMAITAKAKSSGYKGVIIPKDNGIEASLIPGIEIYPVSHLKEVISFLRGELSIVPLKFNKQRTENPFSSYNFSEIKGQYLARRAIEIAVAGRHNIALVGSPGSGKSMLAKAIPSILPSLEFDEMIETLTIYSAAGIFKKREKDIFSPPFRSPHHSSSDVGLIGGGTNPRPGEISLAHNGVLFLDELPEFRRVTIESLRQPLEDKEVTITRASSTVTFPSSVMLVTAMNPCPCGYYGDSEKVCKCSKYEIERYQKRISGPLLDRIDMVISVPTVKVDNLIYQKKGESSEEIKKRINLANKIQQNRYKNLEYRYNGKIDPAAIQRYTQLTEEGKKFLFMAAKRFKISARKHDKILKVSRTIADLDNSKDIKIEHLSEAINLSVNLDW